MLRKISGDRAWSIIQKRKDILVLDVRTKEEYDEGHIEGSINVPYDSIKDNAELFINDKQRVIFVYCNSGFRSSVASKIFDSLGYMNVYDAGKMSEIK